MSSTYPNPASPVKHFVLFKVGNVVHRAITVTRRLEKVGERITQELQSMILPGAKPAAEDREIPDTSYRIMTSDQAPITSHGRGGAANITRDDTLYTDGEIVREGPVGDQGNGAYSAGRGGAGNIDSPRQKATNTIPGDEDVVPETAMRESGEGYENYHTGRGGEGNVHREKGSQMHEGLADKLKHKMFGKKEEK